MAVKSLLSCEVTFTGSWIKMWASPRPSFYLTQTHSLASCCLCHKKSSVLLSLIICKPKASMLESTPFPEAFRSNFFLPLQWSLPWEDSKTITIFLRRKKTKMAIFSFLPLQELPQRPFPFVSDWSVCSRFRTFEVHDWTVLTVAKSQANWLPNSRSQLKQFFQLWEAQKLVLLPKLAQQPFMESNPIRNNLHPAMWGQQL